MARFYVYDMSEYLGYEEGWECPENGLYECIDFKKYWKQNNAFPFIIRYKDELVGFVIIDKNASEPKIDFNVAQFFILRKFKNKGIGKYVAQMCFDRFRGSWEVMVIPGNVGAYNFWQKIIKEYTNNQFKEYTKSIKHLDNCIKNIFYFKYYDCTFFVIFRETMRTYRTMPKVIANDISLYYQITGNSDHSVILISGANGDHQSVWPPQVINALAQHFQVIQFDHRGVGQSDQPDIPYSIEMMADDVACLMEALQIEEAHVIGYSMGGQIAAKLAEKYPAKVLTMVGCVCYPTVPIHMRLLGKTIFELLEFNLPDCIIDKIALPWVFSDQFLEKNIISLMQTKEEATSKYSIGFKRHFEAQCAFTSEAECFRNIKIPVLFVAGAEDRICPPLDVMRFVNLIPNSQITIFPEAGHMLSLEYPDKFAHVICEFLIHKKELTNKLEHTIKK